MKKPPYQVTLDGEPCEVINSRLRPKRERPDAVQLAANDGLSFQGTIVLVMGFTLSPEQREALIEKDPRNEELISPYLGGKEVNSTPAQSFHRYVINFGQRSLEEAEAWPDLIERVRSLVKPERDKLRDNSDGTYLKQHWWQFGRTRPGLYKAISPMHRCLVTSCVSKHLMFSFQPTNRVFSHSLYAFPFDSHSHFALLQSRVHELWTRLLSSTMKKDLRYAATDCFRTFPFPDKTTLSDDSPLSNIGEALYLKRAAYMIEANQGLTATYNQLKDPNCNETPIVEMRRLHESVDRAILDAYGWTDIEVPPYTAAPSEGDTVDRWNKEMLAFKDEVIDRLFALNAERAAAEGKSRESRERGIHSDRRRKPAGIV